MSFEFTENFTVEFPNLTDSKYNFGENFSSNRGLIIEVAAIHERTYRQLQ
jgi:hypothetical protein